MSVRALMVLAMLWLGSGLAQALTFKTVIIDAGHGGKDGGAAWHGQVEKRLCLDTALRLERLLKARGLRVVMTRRSDVFVEIDQRTKLANRYPNAIFVSLHFNASRNTSVHGMEVFYRSANGKVLARHILRAMDRRLEGRNRGLFYGNIKVLRATVMPAVVVEAGYLSHRTEARRCGSAAYREALAQAITAGILASRT
jgi:N-acetylmuramoyl-L-alanine amidase